MKWWPPPIAQENRPNACFIIIRFGENIFSPLHVAPYHDTVLAKLNIDNQRNMYYIQDLLDGRQLSVEILICVNNVPIGYVKK